MHRCHFWSVFCSFLIFLSFFEVTFSLAVYKSLFSCCLTEDSGLMLMPNASFYKTSFLSIFYFPLFFTHITSMVSVSNQALLMQVVEFHSVVFSFYFVLLSCLNCSTTMISAPSHSCFSGLSSSLFLCLFRCLVIFCMFSVVEQHLLEFSSSFFSIPSFSFTGDLNDVCLYPCTFIAEWSVFVFRVPCPSSGRSCSMSAGKMKAPQIEPAMVWHSGERCFHFMQGEEVEVPCQ